MDMEKQDSIDMVIKILGTMTTDSTTLAAKNAFSMDFAFPYVMYDYEARNHKVVTAVFLVIGIAQSSMSKLLFCPFSKDNHLISAEWDMTHKMNN